MADDWDTALSTPASHQKANGRRGRQKSDKDDPPQPVFPTVEAWVTEFLAPHIRRPRSKTWRWCPQWWQHPEALSRLEALWRSWEALRLDGTTGMSVWWRDHLDPHLAALTDSTRSPFEPCSEHNGHVTEHHPLKVAPAPTGFWDNSTSQQ